LYSIPYISFVGMAGNAIGGFINFSKSFEKSKKQVENFAELNSKKLRNTIVGYITKLAKKNTK